VILLNIKIKKSFLRAELFKDLSYTYIKNVSEMVTYAMLNTILYIYIYIYIYV